MADKERIAAMAKEIFGDDKPAQSDAPSAEEWLDKHYPKDDSPPFGDESLRDSPSYETTHIMMRDEIPELLEAYAALRTAQADAEAEHHAEISRQSQLAELAATKRAETAESALSEARERAIQECIKIADERVEWNKSAVVRFSDGDQKLMCDRASANAGEASRISEKLNALLAGASGAAGKGGADGI